MLDKFVISLEATYRQTYTVKSHAEILEHPWFAKLLDKHRHRENLA